MPELVCTVPLDYCNPTVTPGHTRAHARRGDSRIEPESSGGGGAEPVTKVEMDTYRATVEEEVRDESRCLQHRTVIEMLHR